MPRTNSKPDVSIMRATTSFVAHAGGIDLPVKAGDLADPESEVVRRYPDLFEPVTLRFVGSRVEQATAAPGEKRGA